MAFMLYDLQILLSSLTVCDVTAVTGVFMLLFFVCICLHEWNICVVLSFAHKMIIKSSQLWCSNAAGKLV